MSVERAATDGRMRRVPVFFDIGDTLVYARRTLHEQVVRVCAEAGHTVTERTVRETAHAIAQRTRRASTLDLKRFEAWWRGLYADLLSALAYPSDIERAQDELWATWRSGSALRLFPDTLESLDRLRAAGVRMGAVSNWDDTFEDVLNRLGIADYFEVTVGSYEVGVEKPDPRIFEIALNAMGWRGDPPWYAGDRVDKDVEGARAAGWRPILVDHFDFSADIPQNGYPVVPSLRAATDLILEEG